MDIKVNLETATFIKNHDDTYTIYQPIGNGGTFIKFPCVKIEMKLLSRVDPITKKEYVIIEPFKKSSVEAKLTHLVLNNIKKIKFQLNRR